MIERLRWKTDSLDILDQRLLPQKIYYLNAKNPAQTAKAIKDMATRGAPLIGCVAAYGYALALKASRPKTAEQAKQILSSAAKTLKDSRPTAVALAYAVDRLHALALGFLSAQKGPALKPETLDALSRLIDAEAGKIHDEDVDANERLSEYGSRLLKRGATVMTICNAGALATAGRGTAVGVISRAHEKGLIRQVYSLETRPYLQGARLTMFELLRGKIPSTLLTDNMAAHIMKTCKIDAVIAGADRIASNGDTANKIGTYMLAVLARYHKVPFYIAAPIPTIDMKLRDGGGIPIEERGPDEVCVLAGRRIAPCGARARHPAFDVTPAGLITAIITENGVIKPVNRRNVRRVVEKEA